VKRFFDWQDRIFPEATTTSVLRLCFQAQTVLSRAFKKTSVSPFHSDFSPPTSFPANYFGSFSFTVPFFLLQCFLSQKDTRLPYRLIPPGAHWISTLLKERPLTYLIFCFDVGYLKKWAKPELLSWNPFKFLCGDVIDCRNKKMWHCVMLQIFLDFHNVCCLTFRHRASCI